MEKFLNLLRYIVAFVGTGLTWLFGAWDLALTIYEENGFILLLKESNIDVTGATQGETQNRMILQDGTGAIWQVTINESGVLQTSKASVD